MVCEAKLTTHQRREAIARLEAGPAMHPAFEFVNPKPKSKSSVPSTNRGTKKFQKKQKLDCEFRRAASPVADHDVAGGPDDQHDQLSPITI